MSETPDNIVPLTPKAVSTMEEFLAEHERELLTILFTDLVDSTQMQTELGNAEAARLVQIHRRLVRDELEKHNSREVEWAGDSCLAVFSMPSDGVRFALTMQSAMRKARATESNLPHVRVGLHLGEIFVHKQQRGAKKSEELFGLQVSEASRVMSLARGDQIYMSRPVYDNARSSMKGSGVPGIGEVVWINHGAFVLKGSDEQVEVCEVGEQGHSPLTAPEANEKCRPASASREIDVITPEIVTPMGRKQGSPIGGLLRTVVLVLLAASLSGGTVWLLSRPDPPPVQRFAIATDTQETFFADNGNLAVSPDGSKIVYAAGLGSSGRLFIRSIDQHDVRPLAGTEGARSPFFSPDGEWIGFFGTPANLKKVSVHGGAVLTLASATDPRGGTWSEGGTIIYAPNPNTGLWIVPAEGGEAKILTEREPRELSHRWPHFLPGGQSLLFTLKTSQNLDEATIAVLELDTGEHHALLAGGTYPRYVPTGHVTFGHSGTLMAFPFDLETLTRTGSPGPVVDGVSTHNLNGGAAYAFSHTGLLIYGPGDALSNAKRKAFWVSPQGEAESLPMPEQEMSWYSLSPDASRVAITILSEAGTQDVWVYDVARETMTRLTFEGTNILPVWTPDGERIVFSSDRNGSLNLHWKLADGSGTTERLAESDDVQWPSEVSPDGKTIVFNQTTSATGNNIMTLNLDGDREPQSFVESSFDNSEAAFSPDGNWIAYASSESGRNEIYVRPFPGPGGKWQVSRDGGDSPSWPREDTRIIFRNADKMMAVPVTTEGGFSAGTPELIFEARYYGSGGRNYDVNATGDRFLMLEAPELQKGMTDFRVVTNWFTELEQLVPTGGK